MKSTKVFASILALGFLGATIAAQAATVSGTVTDKTTGKPAAGDQVVALDVQANMSEVAKATTDAKGHYTLNTPGSGPYLIRVTHQGAGYFIAAPQNGGPGDIPVYDVAAKVEGVRIEADVIEGETDPGGQLHIDERYFVHNTSSPPKTQWSERSFRIVLPADATVVDVGAQRPTGLPTSVKLDPDGAKGHYSFNFPIQPDEGDKDTMFQVSYTVPYSSGSYTFKSVLTLPADNLAILLPKSMAFAGGSGATFAPVQADPGVNTYLAKNVAAETPISFTISGTGSIPRDAQANGQSSGGQTANATQQGPGGGIGQPIDTPDPLSKYKWWILGGLALLLAAAAAFLLRKPEGAVAGAGGATAGIPGGVANPAYATPTTPAAKNKALLNALKEELFALESEKLSGTIAAEEYATQKDALETVLKRALKKSSS